MITCLLLAAGEGRRFGSPKALASVGKLKAIEQLQTRLIESSVDEILIVLGANARNIEPYVFNHKKVRVVHNKDYNLGQTSSVKTGAALVSQNSSGIMVALVDTPMVKSETIDLICARFEKLQPQILIPTFKGRRGHPALFNIALRGEILTLPHLLGLNSLFDRFIPQEINVEDQGVLKTFNTAEELRNL